MLIVRASRSQDLKSRSHNKSLLATSHADKRARLAAVFRSAVAFDVDQLLSGSELQTAALVRERAAVRRPRALSCSSGSCYIFAAVTISSTMSVIVANDSV